MSVRGATRPRGAVGTTSPASSARPRPPACRPHPFSTPAGGKPVEGAPELLTGRNLTQPLVNRGPERRSSLTPRASLAYLDGSAPYSSEDPHDPQHDRLWLGRDRALWAAPDRRDPVREPPLLRGLHARAQGGPAVRGSGAPAHPGPLLPGQIQPHH